MAHSSFPGKLGCLGRKGMTTGVGVGESLRITFASFQMASFPILNVEIAEGFLECGKYFKSKLKENSPSFALTKERQKRVCVCAANIPTHCI